MSTPQLNIKWPRTKYEFKKAESRLALICFANGHRFATIEPSRGGRWTTTVTMWSASGALLSITGCESIEKAKAEAKSIWRVHRAMWETAH
jgi:hypothetical protein